MSKLKNGQGIPRSSERHVDGRKRISGTYRRFENNDDASLIVHLVQQAIYTEVLVMMVRAFHITAVGLSL